MRGKLYSVKSCVILLWDIQGDNQVCTVETYRLRSCRIELEKKRSQNKSFDVLNPQPWMLQHNN